VLGAQQGLAGLGQEGDHIESVGTRI
jgi:hypothetical protein